MVRDVTGYQWAVLAIASVGWIFDVLRINLHLTMRNRMMAELCKDRLLNDPAVRFYGEVIFGFFLLGGTVGGVLFRRRYPHQFSARDQRPAVARSTGKVGYRSNSPGKVITRTAWRTLTPTRRRSSSPPVGSASPALGIGRGGRSTKRRCERPTTDYQPRGAATTRVRSKER